MYRESDVWRHAVRDCGWSGSWTTEWRMVAARVACAMEEAARMARRLDRRLGARWRSPAERRRERARWLAGVMADPVRARAYRDRRNAAKRRRAGT